MHSSTANWKVPLHAIAMNEVSKDIEKYWYLFRIKKFNSFYSMTGSGIAGSHGILILFFWRISILLYILDVKIHIANNSAHGLFSTVRLTNKAGGRDGIPVELFQILNDDAVKLLHSICQQTWKAQQWPQDWKRSVFIPIPKKDNPKESSDYHTTALISHASKVMLKILQARLQQYINREFPDVQAGFRKGRGTRDHCQCLLDHQKSNKVPEKHLFLLYWLC